MSTDPTQPAAGGFSEMADKMVKAAKLLSQIRDEDVDVGTTPKKLVMRRDKVELFRYEALAPRRIETPVIIAYGLIGRYTMAIRQPDATIRGDRGKYLKAWRRLGAWLIVADSWSSNLPAAR